MKIKVVLSLSFLFFYSIIFALMIKSVVIDSDGNPIADVIVTNGREAANTDESGFFRMQLTDINQVLIIHKIGYKEKKYPTRYIPGIIILERDAIQIEGTKISEKKPDEFLPAATNKIIIENTQAAKHSNAAEILSQNTTLKIEGNSLLGERKTAAFQGFDARHTLILIDGIPMNKNGEAFDLSSIPAHIIENIEILQNDGSSGAAGGVININTISVKKRDQIAVGSSLGSFSLNKQFVDLAISKNKFQIYSHFGRSYSKNNFKYKPKEFWSNPDSLRERVNNEKMIYDLDLNLNLDLAFGKIRYNCILQDFYKQLPGPTSNPELFHQADLEGYSLKNHLQIKKAIKNFALQFDHSFSRARTTFDNTNLEEPWASNFNYYVLNKNLNDSFYSRLKLLYRQDNFSFDYGIDHLFSRYEYKELTDPDDSIGAKSQNNFAVFASSDLSKKNFPSELKLHLSGRIEQTSLFDRFASWKIAPEWHYDTLLHFVWGGSVNKGFTVPSFYNLYWKGDSQSTGNPELIPEKVLGWNLFSKVIINKSFLKIAYRNNKLKNKIIWIQDFNKSWKPLNIGEAEISEISFSSRIMLGKWLEISFDHLITSAIDKTKISDGTASQAYNKELIYTPQYSLNAGINFSFSHYGFGINYREKGKQFTNQFNQSSENTIPPYHLIDANFSYRRKILGIEYQLGMIGRNLEDNLYEIYEYLPQPGFNWEMFLNLKYEI